MLLFDPLTLFDSFQQNVSGYIDLKALNIKYSMVPKESNVTLVPHVTLLLRPLSIFYGMSSVGEHMHFNLRRTNHTLLIRMI